jgi:hypothetical protein
LARPLGECNRIGVARQRYWPPRHYRIKWGGGGVAARNIDNQGLTTFVTLHVAYSFTVELSETYELALFDSDIPSRGTEFTLFYNFLASFEI